LYFGKDLEFLFPAFAKPQTVGYNFLKDIMIRKLILHSAFFIMISLMLISCGAVKDLELDAVNKNVTKIDGVFKNLPKKSNIIHLLNRELLNDSLRHFEIDDYDRFSISELDHKKLKFTICGKNNKEITREYKYSYQKNIYYLENKNVKPLLIPFLFGGIDEKRLYLYINKDNNLEINVYESTAGAIFFIAFLGSHSGITNHAYERVNQ
jgi:hypothetical protein